MVETSVISRKEASRYLGSIGCPISVAILAQFAMKNGRFRAKGPPFSKIFGRTYYEKRDLEAWAKTIVKRVE